MPVMILANTRVDVVGRLTKRIGRYVFACSTEWRNGALAPVEARAELSTETSHTLTSVRRCCGFVLRKKSKTKGWRCAHPLSRLFRISETCRGFVGQSSL
jgi:hypothetical protein